jgi:predicted DNA-binding transcriptional regulator AlpA
MGQSIMAVRYAAKIAAQRLQERLQADEAAAAELDRFRQDWLDRDRAAAALGIKPRTLKAWQAEGRGPEPQKAGSCRQSRVYWRRSEIDAYLRDPAGFQAAKKAGSADAR